jgi:hypothetical protein
MLFSVRSLLMPAIGQPVERFGSFAHRVGNAPQE